MWPWSEVYYLDQGLDCTFCLCLHRAGMWACATMPSKVQECEFYMIPRVSSLASYFLSSLLHSLTFVHNLRHFYVDGSLTGLLAEPSVLH